MKIAVVSLTRNDHFRLKSWTEYFQEYKDEIFEHIIIDNGSTQDYLEELRYAFPQSTIIELGYNGGCTGAYNAGIKHALNNPDIDAIALIGNDVKIEKGGLIKLYEILYSIPNCGMVGPVLLKKDSDIIESFGSSLNPRNGLRKILHFNENIRELKGKTMEVGYVAGGANISRRSFYESDGVGLQDENLFMYGDERNMALRAARKGYKEIVTSDVLSWHQHINLPSSSQTKGGGRNPIVGFLIARNFMYTQKAFFSRRITYQVAGYLLLTEGLRFLRHVMSKTRRQYFYNYIRGLNAGLKGKMDNSIFISGL